MWQSRLRKVTPYTPGEQPGVRDMVKLNTNENPYPPAPGVVQAIKNFEGESLRLYPEPAIKELREELANYYGFLPEQVFVGVGSDDVLAMSFLAFFNGEGKILFPDITYSFYSCWAKLFGIDYETLPLDKDFNIDLEMYGKKNAGIVLANPNAPTGNVLELEKIEDLLGKNKDSVVIIDEAYIDFGGVSAMSLVNKYDNLAVVGTFSKSRSLAGMRIGFAIGGKELIKALSDVKYSFNSYTLSNLAIRAGVESLRDEVYFRDSLEKIINTREESKEKLRKLGFSFPDSKTNFIFAKHESRNAKDIFNYLRSKNIFVRYFDKPRIDNYIRISVGTDKEMNILFAELEKFLSIE